MDYLNAGADVLTSATYQASIQGFQARGIGKQQAVNLLRLGVELACRVRDEFWSSDQNRQGRLQPLVAASIGPFGACLHDGSEYHGNYSASWAEVEAFHRSRLNVLTDCGADILAFETIPSQPEAEILLELLAAYPKSCAWLSFSCRDDAHVSHGESLRQAATMAGRHSQIAAVGVNCTAPRYVSALLNSLKDIDRPLLAYPNSGESWMAENNRWVGQAANGLNALEWFRAGARLIGGCCRTGPKDIASIRSALKSGAAGP
jgi:homocysteine S-methyltransferase